MRIAIPSTTAALAVAGSIAWPITALALTDLIVNVDCASGGRINQALSRPTLVDRRLVVVISGTCAENVTIERDDVILRAQSGGGVSAADATKPAILINGARRVALEGLSVTGGLHGVLVTGGAAASIRSGAIRNAARNGVRVEGGASAVVDGTTIENNVQNGVTAEGAGVTMTGSTVQGNGFSGIASVRGGSAFLGADNAGTACCGNTIANNANDGLTVTDGSSAILYGNVIQGNGSISGRNGILANNSSVVVLRAGNLIHKNGSASAGAGIFARSSTIRTGPGDAPLSPTTNEFSGNTFGIQGLNNSFVDLRGGVSVTGNTRFGVWVDQGSRLRTDGSTISANGIDGVYVLRASSAEFVGNANVVSGNGNYGLYCNDGESSYSGSFGGTNPAGVSCTGF